MAQALHEYIVELQGKRYRITSDRADLTPEMQQALALRSVGKSTPETGQGPSLTQGPYPGESTTAPPPDTRQEMPWYARAPAEVGLPAVGGIVGGMIAGPAGAIGGAGLGQMVGSELNKRLIAEQLGFAPPPPSFSQEPGREAALQFGVGAAAEAIPGAAIMGARRLVTGPTPAKAGETLQAFRDTGVQPKLTDLAEGRLPGRLESFTRQSLTGAGPIDKAMTAQAERLTAAASEFTDRLGPILGQSEQAVGGRAKQAILSGLERGQGIEDTMWHEFQALAPGTQVTPIGMVGWAREVLGRERQGLATTQDPKSRQLAREILRKSHTEGTMHSVPLEQLDLWRKDIGQTLKKSELISGFDQGRLRHLYGTLMDDAETGIQYTGSQALQDKWQEVRGFSKQLIELYRNSSVAKVVDMTPEAITAQLTGAGGITQLRQWKAAIRGEIDPQMGPDPQQAEAWNMARRHIFEGLVGETTHGAGKAVQPGARGLSATTISGKQLGRVMDRMGDDVLNELLSPEERRALTNIRLVANAIEKGGRVGAVPYTSITGQNANIQGLLTAMAGLGGAAAGGEAWQLATGVAGSLLVPRLMAKALTNPKAVEVFASPGFGRLSMEFSKRQVSRESAATLIRLVGLSQEAGGAPEAQEGTPHRRRGLTLSEGTTEPLTRP